MINFTASDFSKGMTMQRDVWPTDAGTTNAGLAMTIPFLRTSPWPRTSAPFWPSAAGWRWIPDASLPRTTSTPPG